MRAGKSVGRLDVTYRQSECSGSVIRSYTIGPAEWGHRLSGVTDPSVIVYKPWSRALDLFVSL